MGRDAALSELRAARVQRAPGCCAVHAAWDALLGRPAILVRRWQLLANPTRRWRNVPVCGVFHAEASRLPLVHRLARIARFELCAVVRGRRWVTRRLDKARTWMKGKPDPREERWWWEEDELRRRYFDPG